MPRIEQRLPPLVSRAPQAQTPKTARSSRTSRRRRPAPGGVRPRRWSLSRPRPSPLGTPSLRWSRGSDFPLPVLDLQRLFSASGLPTGVINVVSGPSVPSAIQLAGHRDVDALWYFGPPEGWEQVEAASSRDLKTRVGGGWAPGLVCGRAARRRGGLAPRHASETPLDPLRGVRRSERVSPERAKSGAGDGGSTLYRSEENGALRRLQLSASPDQATWAPLHWERSEPSAGAGGWAKVELTGVAGEGARFLRLSLPAELGPDRLQLGYVELLYREPRHET